jgi:hypothetical protein
MPWRGSSIAWCLRVSLVPSAHPAGSHVCRVSFAAVSDASGWRYPEALPEDPCVA